MEQIVILSKIYLHGLFKIWFDLFYPLNLKVEDTVTLNPEPSKHIETVMMIVKMCLNKKTINKKKVFEFKIQKNLKIFWIIIFYLSTVVYLFNAKVENCMKNYGIFFVFL